MLARSTEVSLSNVPKRMEYIRAKNLARAMKIYGDVTDHIKCAGRLGKFPIFGDTFKSSSDWAVIKKSANRRC